MAAAVLTVSARIDGVEYPDVGTGTVAFHNRLNEIFFGAFASGEAHFDLRNIKVGTLGYGSSDLFAPVLADLSEFTGIKDTTGGSGTIVASGGILSVDTPGDLFAWKETALIGAVDVYVQLQLRRRTGDTNPDYTDVSYPGGALDDRNIDGIFGQDGDASWWFDGVGGRFGSGTFPPADNVTWVTIDVLYSWVPATATLTLTPNRGVPGSEFTLHGTNYLQFDDVTATFGGLPLDIDPTETSAGGHYTGTAFVPLLGTGTYTVTLSDSEDTAEAEFTICRSANFDTPNLDVAPPMLGYKDIATWFYRDDNTFDYIHHDGHHWAVNQWFDLVGHDHTVFPPPAGIHGMSVRRVDAAGATLDTYYVDLDWFYGFNSNITGYLFCQEWDCDCSFTEWDMRVLDARFASDGTNLWLAVIARECIPYPYLSAFDGTTPTGCSYPSQVTQFQPLSTLEATYANFHRYFHSPSGLPSAGTSPPDSDGGDGLSGHYSPARLILFHFNGTGFDRIGTVDAKYNYDGGGTDQTVLGGLSASASPTQPGVCHVVWSEGGPFGTRGFGTGWDPGNPPVIYQTWDHGFPNIGYRVNYSRWSAAAKTLDNDILNNVFDRTSWYSLDTDGNQWSKRYPPSDQIAATPLLSVRNDHGSPVLFISRLYVKDTINPDYGYHWYLPDAAEPTLRMWDLATGFGVELHALSGDLLPTADEAYNQFPRPSSARVPNRLYLNWDQNYKRRCRPGNAAVSLNFNAFADGYAIASKYHDPRLGVDTYLFHISWANEGNYSRGFYRIPCNGSDTFSLIDGNRNIAIFPSLTNAIFDPSTLPSVSDFTAEPKNIWVPAGGSNVYMIWLDRSACGPLWRRSYLAQGPDPGDENPRRLDNGIPYLDSVGGFVYFVGVWGDGSGGFPVDERSGIVFTTICRNCVDCGCAQGLHMWTRIGEGSLPTPP